jgi:hypothetical protein
MSAVTQFFLLAAIEVAGLFVIWFVVRAKVRRYLELGNLLDGVRDEARALVLELNETADRNVSLVEDRMAALHELLAEADRRIAVGKKELASRESERDVYAMLNKRRPIVPEPASSATAIEPILQEPNREALRTVALDAPVILTLGRSEANPPDLRRTPEISALESSVVPGRTKREEALELYRRGFSAELIAVRTGATVAEIELLVEIEERRAAGRGSGP